MKKDSLFWEIQDLRAGDLVLFQNTPRLIRMITKCSIKRHNLYGYNDRFFFAIKRVSWTNKPYTCYPYYAFREGYGGILKRDVPLVTNKKKGKVQYFIENLSDLTNTKYWAFFDKFPKMEISAREMAGEVR